MTDARAVAFRCTFLALGFLALPVPLCAQYDHLVTTDDGGVLYFSSLLRMRDTEQFSHRKLFVVDAQGVRLHSQRGRQGGLTAATGAPVSNYYSIEAAALSGDGSLVGVIARRECNIGSGCVQVPRIQTEIAGNDFRGAMSLSRNGRFALLEGDGSTIPYEALIDLSSGQKLEWLGIMTGALTRYGRRGVTSDGTALVASTTGFLLKRFDDVRVVPLPDRPFEAVIDDEGKSAVYEAVQWEDGERKLVHVDLASGAVRLLAASTAPMQPCLSNDGGVVLFLSDTGTDGASQMFVMNTDGTGLRQLTHYPSGITDHVLSGNGKVAYAVSATGRLFRIEVQSGAIEQVIGRSVALETPSRSSPPYPVPGSAFSIVGSGFADFAESVAPPLPLNLNGLELILDGRPLPLQTVAPSKVMFQLPWDITAGVHRLEARIGSDAFFATEPVELEVRSDAFAQFELLPEEFGLSPSRLPYALAVHFDFGSLVTRESPARPGEIIHLYMTGLGPVYPAVESGAPSPWDPPARVRLPFSCHFAPKEFQAPQRPAEILFAGLAPVFAGYYQVSLRIPEDISIIGGSALIGCGLPQPGSGTSERLPMTEQ